MDLRRTALLALTLGLTLAPEALSAQADPSKGPDTVTFTRRGTLVYTHAKHAEMAECVSCHHASKPEKPSESEYQKCDACHTDPATAPLTTSLRNAYHNTETREGMCYTCHKAEAAKGVDVPMRCIDCHPREPAPRRN
jgi:cytochrome c553